MRTRSSSWRERRPRDSSNGRSSRCAGAPSADLDTARRAHERRYLEWWWEPDGSLRVAARLSPDDGAAFIEAIETAAEAIHATPAARPPLGARRADALVEMAFSGSPRFQVVLHADPTALAC